MNRSNATPRSFSADQLRTALGGVGGVARPDYLADIVAQAGHTRQRPGWTFPARWLPTDIAVRRQSVPRMAVLSATLVLLALLAVAGVYVSSQPTPPGDLGIFKRVAGWIVYGNQDGIWGVDPGSSNPATTVALIRDAGTPLGWSNDGTKLLLQKNRENLFVLHADGSETQVTDQLSGNNRIPGSWMPSGATISPDGSRVVFAGQTKPPASDCHDGALFAADADGGPTELLWKSQAHNGIVKDPTFSPDGKQIAFVDGYCDSDHSVWVMNADGSDAHQIVTGENTPLGATWVYGLAWSPAGDRIALSIDEGIFSFATDGSGFTRITGGTAPLHWSPDGSRLAFSTRCPDSEGTSSRDGCNLVIADADGSEVWKLLHGVGSGPWHPGLPSAVPSMEPTVAPAASPRVAGSPPVERSSPPGYLWPESSLDEVHQAQALADAGDPRYTWQVDHDLGTPMGIGQNHPLDAKIFPRFLQEVLGWQNFRDGHHVPRLDGSDLNEGDFLFIRCAPGGKNPLYPVDPGATCAPTIDELRYETVKITVAQPDRQLPDGIWVVTGWEMVGPAVQVDPRVEEAEATALLEDFLQARIDGEGAEELTGLPGGLSDEEIDREIPLLYATSTGSPYVRSGIELVDGPTWPDARMEFEVRLFTEDDETVVEQRFSLARDETGRMYVDNALEPSTTENGKAVPVEYSLLDGEVTFRAAAPLTPYTDEYRDVAFEGLAPDDFALLLMLADPTPFGPGCLEAEAPTAEALVRIIESNPRFETTSPVGETIGGIPAMRIDVVVKQRASICQWPEGDITESGPLLKYARFEMEDRARLYLIDLPAGSQARVLGIVIITDEDSFEGVMAVATPIVNSIEFHAP